MKISIFGSTGKTGIELIEQGLEKRLGISSIVRHLPDANDNNLNIIIGDIFDKRLVKEVIDKSDMVISVLAYNPPIFGKKSTKLYSKAASVLVESMGVHNSKKLLFCTSAGVEEDSNEPWYYKYIFKPFYLRKGYEDMQIAEKIITDSTLDWILVRPTRLINGPLTAQFRVSEKGRPKGGGVISRADLAFFILNQVSSNDWVHKKPIIAYD